MKTLDELKDNVIDSRDLISAMEEWQSIVNDEDIPKDERDIAKEELNKIKEFVEPFECYGDWEYGETLISEDYWEEYVKELICDCGYICSDFPSWIEIDWEKTAENVAMDYVNDNGYYMRA